MDLVCHENFTSAIDTDHHLLHHKEASHHKICQHDDYMSSNSNSSSYSYSLSPPPSLSQYSISSSLSSGIGSLVGTEDSNFGDLTRSSSHCSLTGDHQQSSFSHFRRQYSPEVHEDVVVVEQEEIVETSVAAAEEAHEVAEEAVEVEESHIVSRSGATKRSQSQQTVYYNHSPKIRKADRDPVFLENRCLANLFELEAQLYPSSCGNMKGDINEQMRRIVAGWMMEVSLLQSIFAVCVTFH